MSFFFQMTIRIKFISPIMFDFDGNHVNPILILKQSVLPSSNTDRTYLNNLILQTRRCGSEKGGEGHLGLLTPSPPTLLPILLPAGRDFCLQSPQTTSQLLPGGWGLGPAPAYLVGSSPAGGR